MSATPQIAHCLVTHPPAHRDAARNQTVRVVPDTASGMDEARPRLRPNEITEQVPHTRAELVRYFAWGYLSRRELNERLKRSTQAPQGLHSAA